jgi:hypothetical protein
MQKKKTTKKKKTAKRAAKKRSQKVNRPQRAEMLATEEFKTESESTASKKVICFNMECRLRRAGCYGYEACPGFKGKG